MSVSGNTALTNFNPSTLRLFKTSNQPQQCGFAAARGAEQTQKFARLKT